MGQRRNRNPRSRMSALCLGIMLSASLLTWGGAVDKFTDSYKSMYLSCHRLKPTLRETDGKSGIGYSWFLQRFF
jgi:hypothetical protein